MTLEQAAQNALRHHNFLQHDTAEHIFTEGFEKGANWQSSQHEWVKCSDRRPTEADAVDGEIEFLWWDELGQHYEFIKLKLIFFIRSAQIPVDYWRTPLANNFPPPKTEI